MDNLDNLNQYGTTQDYDTGSGTHKGSARTYRPERRPQSGGMKAAYKEASPEEIQKMVSEKVAKAVAAAAGAVEGFANQMRDSKVAENTRHAIEEVGETTSTIVGTTREQFNATRDAIKGEGGGEGEGQDSLESENQGVGF